MENIEDLLRALAGDEDENDEHNDEQNKGQSSEKCDKCDNSGQSGGLFSGLDPEMLIKLFGLLETLNQPDDSERFLLALKPLLREENRPKIDSALRLIKLISLFPVLKETGLFDNML